MRVPEAAEQVTSAPIRALRAFFAGIGQLLVAADKFREETEFGSADDHYDIFREWGRPPAPASPGGTDAAGEPAASAGSGSGQEAGRRSKARPAQPRGTSGRFRSLDSTGNVRVLTPEDPAEPAAARLASTDRAADEPPAPLPIARYDGLSLPSLRSRLRTLDAAQVRILLDYERSNARRDDVMGMFERRIAKLLAAGSDAT